jgi:L-rhamnose mutarotase
MAEAYDKAHATIWPELRAAQLEVGIRRWLIFRDGLDLFHVVECDDFEGAIGALENMPVDQRWQAEMAKFVVQRPDGRGGDAVRLKLVYDGDSPDVES